ncbi:MAG: nucleotide exchange factor GrpE [Patescibacteria group bacterium]|jgi:molecular chaperone GrpE
MNKKDTSSMNEQSEPKTSPEIEELKNKIDDLTTGWQRTQADFINFRNQTTRERSQLAKIAKASLIEEILPVLDNFALAAKHLPEELKNNSWAQGVQQVEKQLEAILTNEGLDKIKTIGEQFNPELHEAIEEVESDKAVDEIIEEIAAGYKFDDLIVRPAKVKISKG